MTILRISWYDDEGEQLKLDVEEKSMMRQVVLKGNAVRENRYED
jgi:hypothetical protein